MGAGTSALQVIDGVHTCLYYSRPIQHIAVPIRCLCVYKWSKYICTSVILDYLRHGYVLYRTRIIKTCVCVHHL